MKNEIRRKIKEYVRLMEWTPGDLYWKHAFMVREFALMLQEKIGGEWYFAKVLGNDKEKILNEIEKSFSEIEFDIGKKFIKNAYQKLVNNYSTPEVE
ncbi:MAG: hypothetical protein AAB959_00395 [Patescibacteria group bacterium]